MTYHNIYIFAKLVFILKAKQTAISIYNKKIARNISTFRHDNIFNICILSLMSVFTDRVEDTKMEFEFDLSTFYENRGLNT